MGDTRAPAATAYRGSAANASAAPPPPPASHDCTAGVSGTAILIGGVTIGGPIGTAGYDRAAPNDGAAAIGGAPAMSSAAMSRCAPAAASGCDLHKLAVVGAKSFRGGDRRAHGGRDGEGQGRDARKARAQDQLAQFSDHPYLPRNYARGVSALPRQGHVQHDRPGSS